jgi:hypothetical protein
MSFIYGLSHSAAWAEEEKGEGARIERGPLMNESEWNACTDRVKMLTFLCSRVGESRRRRPDFPYYWEDGAASAPEMRKMRLFVCACVGRCEERLPDERSREAVQVAARFADGRATVSELDAAWASATAAAQDAQLEIDASAAASERAAATAETAFKSALRAELAAEHALEVAARSWQEGEGGNFAEAWSAAEAADGQHRVARAVAESAEANADAAAEAYHLTLRRLDAAWDAAWAANRRVCRAACVVDGPENGVRREDVIRELWGNPFRPPVIDPSWLSWNNGLVAQLAEAIYEENAFERMPLLADALLDAGCTDEQILTHCRGAATHVRGCWVLDALLGKE